VNARPETVAPLRSPCISICEMDRASGLCRGCKRTLNEIARWSSMTDAERDQVLMLLPGRSVRAT
jgi:predicted Fe-S protein YdhL (DUF1289 family)